MKTQRVEIAAPSLSANHTNPTNNHQTPVLRRRSPLLF